MIGFLIIMGGITIFVGIITLLDWLARRKERRSERQVIASAEHLLGRHEPLQLFLPILHDDEAGGHRR